MKVYSFSKQESVVNNNGNIKRYKRIKKWNKRIGGKKRIREKIERGKNKKKK